jgi:hypothetical protein
VQPAKRLLWQVLNDLSYPLRCEVVRFMFADVINRVPIFAGNDMGFITQLLMSFKMEIAGPGDYIIREGTHGRCMYILHRGRVEVQPHLPCGWMPPLLHCCNTVQRSALQHRTTCCNTDMRTSHPCGWM